MKDSLAQHIQDNLNEHDEWDDGEHADPVAIWNVWTARDGSVRAHIGDKLVTITVDVQDYPA
jgi:hypothetical protein